MHRNGFSFHCRFVVAVVVVVATACSSNDAAVDDEAVGVSVEEDAADAIDVEGSDGDTAPTAEPSEAVASRFLADYQLNDETFGTSVSVTIASGQRTIVSNALPDHETGEFPNAGNPNAISAQSQSWTFPLEAVFVGEPAEVRVPGVAVNGVKFEPGTAETVTCASGETYRVEAIQTLVNLGLDFNNAHVQPTGEYHYHGISELLVEAYATEDDLVHIGFAADGHLIYFSKSGAFEPSYELSPVPRTGVDCLISLPVGDDPGTLEGTTPDGTYTSDYVFAPAVGDLDECNGAVIEGEYVYLVTETFPYIARCLMGDIGGVAGVGGGRAPRPAQDG